MKFKNFLIALLAILLVLALGAGYLMLTGRASNPFEVKKQATITAEQVEEQITKCSDLTTARLTYKGIVHFEEGQIKYITQNSFNMMYTAIAYAGIDLTDVKVEVQDPVKATTKEDGTKVPATAGKVIVTLPKATLLELKIDEDSLTFYDEKNALFNKAQHTDVQEALQAADADARKNMGKKALLSDAQDQAEEVIRSFVQEVLPDGYELEID